VARARRHFPPGYSRHITRRCHKGEFLLKFEKDRKARVSWLFEAKKRFKLHILNYMATSNRMHLLVLDGRKKEAIPKASHLTEKEEGH
jgi:putative transposase